MNHHLRLCFCCVGVIGFLAGNAQGHFRRSAESPSFENLNDAVQSLPWLAGSDRSLLAAWNEVCDEYLKTLGGPQASLDPWVGRLSSAVAKGVKPGLIDERILSLVSVANPLGFEKNASWGEGHYSARLAIYREIWRQAKKLQATDREQASKLGRLAFGLAAHDGYPTGPGVLMKMLKDDDGDVLLQLGDETRGRLKKLSDDVRSRPPLFPQLIEASQAFDVLMDDKKMHAVGERKKLLDAVSEGWKNWKGYPSEQLIFAEMLWRYACLEKARANPVAVRDIESLVKEMRAAAVGPHTNRWLDQVLNLPGPKLTSSGVKVVSDPNEFKPAR